MDMWIQVFFLLSRLLLCRHIRSCFEEISDRPNSFQEIQPQKDGLFWIHEHLVLRPGYQDIVALNHTEIQNKTSSDYEIDSDTELSMVESSNIEEGEDLYYNNEMLQRLSSGMDVKTSIVEILKFQE